ncbi:MAG: glycosyltransferase, partial [Myxococcota bacterium]
RNAAIDAASEDWIALLDADDAMEPGRLAALLDAAGDGWDFVADDLYRVAEGDLDGPRRRKVRWDLLLDDDEEDEDISEETGEIDLEPIAESVYGTPRVHLFEPEVRPAPGAPGLLNPEDIRTVFPAPLDYAKHCMLLVETFAQTTGAFRDEVVEYAASLFTGLSDPRFGRRSLLSWGPDTGIIGVYPLEVVEHVLLTLPAFLPRVRFGRWIALELGDVPKFELTVTPDLPLILTVTGDILVRGFAVKGGGQPGYCFEPGPEPQTYALTLTTPGHYELLMSARTTDGDTIVDRLLVRVLGDAELAPSLPPRYPDRIAQWPKPTVLELDEYDDDEPPDTPTVHTDAGIDPHELARRQQLDAMGGPKGEQADPIFGVGLDAARAPLRSGADAQPGPFVPLEAPEDVSLSVAEAAVLRLALAAGATYADIQIAGAKPSDGNEPTEVLPVWPDTAVEPTYESSDEQDFDTVVSDDVPGYVASSLPAASELAEPSAAMIAAPTELPSADASAPAESCTDMSSAPSVPATATPLPTGGVSASPVLPAPFSATPEERGENQKSLELTRPDAPVAIGKPSGVVSGTQAQVPGELGPTDRIDLVSDLMVDAAPQQPIDDEDDEL